MSAGRGDQPEPDAPRLNPSSDAVSPPTPEWPDLHTVVFDVNVYLDIAELLGPPFTWEKFADAAIACTNQPRTAVLDQRVASLMAVSMARSGRFAAKDNLEVWVSPHIMDTVYFKAAQTTEGTTPETRGLGWTPAQADDLVVDLVEDLVWNQTYGGSVERVTFVGNPPLDQEDAKVYTAARFAAAEDTPPPIRYCVTNDVYFRHAGGLNRHVTLLFPHEFVALVRRSRNAVAMNKLRGPA